MENVLLFFSLKYQGNWNQIYHALERKEKIELNPLRNVRQEVELPFFTIIADDYPTTLKNVAQPPFVLYYFGNRELLKNYHQTIGVIGDNLYNDYGVQNSESFLNNLIQEKRIILLGDNQGLDNLLQQIVIKNQGKLIIVTRRGLQNFLLEEMTLIESLKNYPDFLVISEFYETPTTAVKDNPEIYNRLKVGLGKAFVFIQNSRNSYDFQLSTCAWNEGRDVFAIPEPLGSNFAGNNLLIKEGAKLVETAEDILNSL